MMKYHTISTSSLASEGKKTLTIYTDTDTAHDKMVSSEAEVTSIRGELEIVQRALKLQTRRCRQLVAEYTKRLQEKEQQYQSERVLRDNQLAKVLRALLIFEARLKQEQKFITHQLGEKDFIIKKQSNEIQKLLASRYCKNCNQYYSPGSYVESLDSSSEYVVTDYHDYQSSNFESMDSSSETYATISEKDYSEQKNNLQAPYEDKDLENKNMYQKNKAKDSLGRRNRKLGHRKSVGNYFEVLKLRSDTGSTCSNEDNTSNDYDNLDSLPAESITDKISIVSERIENTFLNGTNENVAECNDSSSNVSMSDCNNTVIARKNGEVNNHEIETKNNMLNESIELKSKESSVPIKITESIPVFEGDGETNDNWYASASDQEDDEQRDIYRNNPVLECMNQILLQNINDPIHSPPKTPNVERKQPKNKRVKFSDEEPELPQENPPPIQEIQQNDYYETPVQKIPNFYETPQSIYSNDYEQILSKCSETFKDPSPTKVENMQEKEVNKMATKKLSVVQDIDFEKLDSVNNHYYVDMDTKSETEERENKIVRKSKILRTPPALPPKPINLVSKHKMQFTKKNSEDKINDLGLDSEPDYCSISELNLPTNKNVSKKINVVAEINNPNLTEVVSKLEKSPKQTKPESEYDPVVINDAIPNLVIKKNVEKLNVQMAKPIKLENSVNNTRKSEPEIPKLPQVSEIIIPDETEVKKQEERISHDNYVKNNSQILKLKTNRADQTRHPIIIGSSVSSLITSFNNQQLLSEINKKPDTSKAHKRMFSSFENLQNFEKLSSPKKDLSHETLNFDKFDLSQTFEEFKLDDCDIGEEFHVDIVDVPINDIKSDLPSSMLDEPKIPKFNSTTRVELIRATNDVVIPNLNVNSIEQFRKKLEIQKNNTPKNQQVLKGNSPVPKTNEPTYEHFLECTGLSSKSILTPSRMLSNHKSMLKPKDVKLRSKVKSNSVIERNSNSTIKYWSEPYI